MFAVLQAHAGELAHQVGLLGRQAGAGENRKSIAAMLRLNPLDFSGDTRDRLRIRHRAHT